MPRPSLSCNVTLAMLFALWGAQQAVQAALPAESAALLPYITPLAALLNSVVVGKMMDNHNKAAQSADAILRNGYLTRAIGQTIKILTEQSANEHTLPSSKKALRAFANTLPDAWVELLTTPDAAPALSHVTDTQLPEILSRAAGDAPEPAFLDETQWVEIVNALQNRKPGAPLLDGILVTSLARHISAGFIHALRQTLTAENDDSTKAFARLTLDFFAGIRKDLALIKDDTAVTRQTVAVLPQMQMDLSRIVELLEKELSAKNDQISSLMNQISQRPVPSPQAVALAEQIPDDADNYALALKATAESRFDDARRLLRRVEEDKEVELARVYYADANNEFFALRYNEAVKYAQKAAALRPDDAQYQNDFGYYLHHVGRFAEAQIPLTKALAIDEKMLGPKHPNTATSLNNLAALYDKRGKLDKAEPLYSRALAIYEEVLGPRHPVTALSLTNLASLYQVQRRLDEAEPLYVRALDICEETLGPKHTNTATSLDSLALLYQKQGKLDEAEPLYNRALAIREEMLGPKHPDTSQSLNNLAGLYQAQGRLDEAESLFVRAVSIREEVLGPNHSRTATSINNLGVLRFYQGDIPEAERLIRRACEICETVLGLAHPDTASSWRSMQYLLEAQGKNDEAETFRRRAKESEAAFRQLNPESSARES